MLPLNMNFQTFPLTSTVLNEAKLNNHDNLIININKFLPTVWFFSQIWYSVCVILRFLIRIAVCVPPCQLSKIDRIAGIISYFFLLLFTRARIVWYQSPSQGLRPVLKCWVSMFKTRNKTFQYQSHSLRSKSTFFRVRRTFNSSSQWTIYIGSSSLKCVVNVSILSYTCLDQSSLCISLNLWDQTSYI